MKSKNGAWSCIIFYNDLTRSTNKKKGDSLRNPISNGRSRWIPIKLADKKRVVEGQGYPQPSFSIKILGTS